jgi:acyl-CoA synthetase (AMP-forming)/AMP-acid ligase II
VTVFPGVPTVFATLIAMHRRQPLSLPGIKRVTNTAAALPPQFHAPLREIFPNALIFRMYGLTECKRVCYLEPEKLDSKPDSVGKAIPGTEVFLRSPDGSPVPTDTSGILHVRGPHLMKGYWNQPELTAHMLKTDIILGETVLCTHDWFKKDADGDLYFLGRSDDIIKTRGEKVSPVEVENAIYKIAGIKEIAVIGIPDETLGETVKAFVVLDGNVPLTEKDILRHCIATLENFMVPKFVEIVATLPTTDTGKVSKMSLRNA